MAELAAAVCFEKPFAIVNIYPELLLKLMKNEMKLLSMIKDGGKMAWKFEEYIFTKNTNVGK